MVRIYIGRSGLQACAAPWRAVYAASGSDNPFQTWEWFNAWAMRFANDATIRIIVIEESGVPVAVAPMSIGGRRATSLVDNLFADYSEFVLASPTENAAAGALVEAVMKLAKTMHVGPVRSVSQTAMVLDAASAADPGHWLRRTICTNPVINTTGTFDGYLKTRTKRLRQELRTAVNHLNRGSEWRFEEATGGEAFRHLYDALVSFHCRRQDQKVGQSVLAPDVNRAFFRDLPEFLGDAPMRVHMSAITWQERIVSAAYSLVCGKTFFYWMPSFDPAVGIASLGKLHIRCLLDRCFERGLSFDFMGGDEAYKLQWATSCYDVYRYSVYASALACDTYRLKLRVRDALRDTVHASPQLTAIRKRFSKLILPRPEQKS